MLIWIFTELVNKHYVEYHTINTTNLQMNLEN